MEPDRCTLPLLYPCVCILPLQQDISEPIPSLAAKGELIETLIDSDGKAYLEIHHTDHGFPKYHEVPHQHGNKSRHKQF